MVRERVGLVPVRSDHADAILAFETDNRAYFATSISDRGDDYFADFTRHHDELLAEQETGECRFHLLLDESGAVLARMNLYDLADGSADVGFRVAERATGQGVATAALREVCRIASGDYGLESLRAKASDANAGSVRVLAKAGFAPVGPRDVAGRPGTAYVLRLGAS